MGILVILEVFVCVCVCVCDSNGLDLVPVDTCRVRRYRTSRIWQE